MADVWRRRQSRKVLWNDEDLSNSDVGIESVHGKVFICFCLADREGGRSWPLLHAVDMLFTRRFAAVKCIPPKHPDIEQLLQTGLACVRPAMENESSNGAKQRLNILFHFPGQ